MPINIRSVIVLAFAASLGAQTVNPLGEPAIELPFSFLERHVYIEQNNAEIFRLLGSDTGEAYFRGRADVYRELLQSITPAPPSQIDPTIPRTESGSLSSK